MAKLLFLSLNETITITEEGVYIGRGSLPNIEDLNIPAQHAFVKMFNGQLVVKSIEHNPLFYKNKGDHLLKMIMSSEEVSLNEGDLIGLLPDKYWFKIIKDNEDLSGNGLVTITEPVPHGSDHNSSDSKRLPHVKPDPGASGSNNNHSLPDTSTSPKQHPCAQYRIKPDPDAPSSSNDTVTVSKIAETVRNIKADPDAPRHSVTQKRQLQQSSDVINKIPRIGNEHVIKPVCQYGRQCYRQNPAHFAQFRHPDGSIFNTGAGSAIQLNSGDRHAIDDNDMARLIRHLNRRGNHSESTLDMRNLTLRVARQILDWPDMVTALREIHILKSIVQHSDSEDDLFDPEADF